MRNKQLTLLCTLPPHPRSRKELMRFVAVVVVVAVSSTSLDTRPGRSSHGGACGPVLLVVHAVIAVIVVR